MALFDFASWLRQAFPISHRQAKKVARRKKPQLLMLERLEDRTTPTTLYAANAASYTDPANPGNPQTGDTVTWNPGPGTSFSGSVPGLTYGTNAFGTIQAAVTAASSGDTIDVASGTYTEKVVISTANLTVDGAQYGVNAESGRPGADESIVNGAVNGNNRTTSFDIAASHVTLDGFTVEYQNDPNVFGAGIVMASNTSGVDVLNNIVTKNAIGIYADSNGASLIQHNLITGNNTVTDGNGNVEPSGGAGIYSDATSHLTIDANTFTNQTQNNPIIFAASDAVDHTNLMVSNNTFNNAYGIYALGISGGLFQGNTIRATDPTYGFALTFGGSDTNIQVLNNDLSNNLGGLDVEDDGYYSSPKPNSDITAHLNSFANDSQFGVGVIDASGFGGHAVGYTGAALDASGNWWGTAVGANPSDLTAPTAINGLVKATGGPVTVGSFLNSGANTATVGFTPATTTEMWVPKTAATTGLTYVDGNIQEGVNSAVSGMTVRVAADTYAENVVVGTSVNLKGANVGVNPITGTRTAETIVEPGLTSSYNTDSIFQVTANNVTIDGFTIQGSIASPPMGQSSSFTLTTGTTVYAAAGVSNSANINTGGSAPSTTNIFGLTVQNNIIQDFTQVGVYGDTSDGTVSTGNLITDNLITDVPENGQGGYYGEGVIIYDNFYADVTDNKLTKVRTGIQTGNNYLSAGIFAPSISDNTVSAYVKGVYFNLQYASASTFTVSGNTITQADATVSPAYNVGLLIQSIQSAVTADITGNDVSGFLYGVEFAGNDTTNTVTVQGGTLNDNTYGVWDTNNDYFYPANYNTTAVLDGVTITNSTTAGVWVDSTSANSSSQFDTTDSTTLAVTDGTSITGGPIGLLVDGALSLASLKQSTISTNTTGVEVETGGALTSATQNFITGNTTGIAVASGAGTIGKIFDNDLAGNTTAIANSSVLIDASGNWWGSATSAGVRAAFTGPVDYTPFLVSGTDTDLVTPGFQGDFSVLDVDALSPQATTTGRIQEGVNDVTAGGTVNVLAGTYDEAVLITKDLTLAGVSGNPTDVVITPPTGDGITITSTAANVTIQDLKVTGATNGVNATGVTGGTVTLQDLELESDATGFAASGETTLNLTDLTLSSNGAGGTISGVTTVNETPSSGSTPTNVMVSGSSFVSDLNQAISLSSILNFIVNGGSGSDTFNVTPSSTTTFTVHGNLPTPPASPGDTLVVPSSGALSDTYNPNMGYSGSWTFGGDKAINFDGIETLKSGSTTVHVPTYAAADFSGHGVYRFVDTGATSGWTSLQTSDASQVAVDGQGDVVAVFTSGSVSAANVGVWLYPPTGAAEHLSGSVPTAVAIASPGYVVATFPTSLGAGGEGVWRFENGSWDHLNVKDQNSTAVSVPAAIQGANASLVGIDGAGNVVGAFGNAGLWSFVSSSNSWLQLASGNVSLLQVASNGIVAAESPGYGVYEWLTPTSASYAQVSTQDVSLLSVNVNNVLAVVFQNPAMPGIYRFAAPTPPAVNPTNPQNLNNEDTHEAAVRIAAADGVFATFTDTPGLYYYSATTDQWSQIFPADASAATPVEAFSAD